MLARRGHADGPAPGAAAPPAPASRPAAAPDAQSGLPGRPAPGLRAALRRAGRGRRRP